MKTTVLFLSLIVCSLAQGQSKDTLIYVPRSAIVNDIQLRLKNLKDATIQLESQLDIVDNKTQVVLPDSIQVRIKKPRGTLLRK